MRPAFWNGEVLKQYTDYDYIIWDFNGTLLDDVDTGIKAVNSLLKERSLPIIDSREKYYSVFKFPVIDYYRTLGFDFDKESYEEIAPKWVALYLEYVKSAGLNHYCREAIDIFEDKGLRQIILSASECSMLCEQLAELGILSRFEKVLGLDNIYAGSKLHIARKWREEHPAARALMIGDTDHDAITAREMGADCVLIARGHQSREHLERVGVPVFDSLEQLCESMSLSPCASIPKK